MNNVPVYHQGRQLKNPFTGGMNASIINQMDLNNDGRKDLVVVQQVNSKPNRIQTYIHNGNADYIYTPKYEAFFPKDVDAVFLLKDLNEDKLEDLIFKTESYFLLYYNKRINDSSFQFTFYDTIETNSYDPLYGTTLLSALNLYLPIIRDIDGDGDQDMIYLRNGVINKDERWLFKNYKKEKSLPANQNEFHNDNKYYGQNTFNLNPLRFKEGYYSQQIKGIAPPNRTLRPRHDEYQMIWDLDINNDGLYDAVAYSENQRNAPLGINIGTKDSAYLINYDTFFPHYTKPISRLMPFGYWIDIDNDAKNDILTSFFIERDNSGTVIQDKLFNDDINTISYYKNYGKKSISEPYGKFHDSFSHVTDSFLSIETIDVGTSSQPIFYNYDQDSLIDILIPNLIKRDSWEVSSIAYYKNIGSRSQPQYKLIDKDLFQFKAKSRACIRMASGDLDGDGKADLLISSYDKAKWGSFASSPLTSIRYDVFYQKSNNGGILFLADTLNIDYIDKYGRSNMCLSDVDKDGKTDLFIGDLYSLKYYKNRGTTSTPLFDKVTCDSVISPCDIYCQPFTNFNFYPAVWKDSKDNKDYLFFAYYFSGGKIGKAIIDTQKLNNNLSLSITPNLYSNYSINYYPTIDIKDVTNDGISELIIGNYAGGIQLFSFDSLTGVKDPPPPPVKIQSSSNPSPINIYPNPTTGLVWIELTKLNHSTTDLMIYSLEGKWVGSYNLKNINEKIDLSPYHDGIYFLKFIKANESTQTYRIVKKSQ